MGKIFMGNPFGVWWALSDRLVIRGEPLRGFSGYYQTG